MGQIHTVVVGNELRTKCRIHSIHDHDTFTRTLLRYKDKVFSNGSVKQQAIYNDSKVLSFLSFVSSQYKLNLMNHGITGL